MLKWQMIPFKNYLFKWDCNYDGLRKCCGKIEEEISVKMRNNTEIQKGLSA